MLVISGGPWYTLGSSSRRGLGLRVFASDKRTAGGRCIGAFAQPAGRLGHHVAHCSSYDDAHLPPGSVAWKGLGDRRLVTGKFREHRLDRFSPRGPPGIGTMNQAERTWFLAILHPFEQIFIRHRPQKSRKDSDWYSGHTSTLPQQVLLDFKNIVVSHMFTPFFPEGDLGEINELLCGM